MCENSCSKKIFSGLLEDILFEMECMKDFDFAINSYKIVSFILRLLFIQSRAMNEVFEKRFKVLHCSIVYDISIK